MMLDRPEMIEANLVSQFRLRHDLLVAVTLDSVVVRFTNLDFIHEPELHSRVLQMRADRHLRSDAYPVSSPMLTLLAHHKPRISQRQWGFSVDIQVACHLISSVAVYTSFERTSQTPYFERTSQTRLLAPLVSSALNLESRPSGAVRMSQTP